MGDWNEHIIIIQSRYSLMCYNNKDMWAGYPIKIFGPTGTDKALSLDINPLLKKNFVFSSNIWKLSLEEY